MPSFLVLLFSHYTSIHKHWIPTLCSFYSIFPNLLPLLWGFFSSLLFSKVHIFTPLFHFTIAKLLSLWQSQHIWSLLSTCITHHSTTLSYYMPHFITHTTLSCEGPHHFNVPLSFTPVTFRLLTSYSNPLLFNRPSISSPLI